VARQARSLDVLLAEVNAAHGNRSKVSDGGIGDPAHASRVSDHNPNAAGVWRARDFTDDTTDDNHDGLDDDMFDCDAFAAALVAMYHAPDVHPAMRSGAYTIWDYRIYSYDRRDEGWRPYGGSNPHDKHLHQSVATSASGYDSTAPWGVFAEPEDDMPAYTDWSEEDKKALAKDVAAIVVPAVVSRLLNTDLTPHNDENDTTVRGALNRLARGKG
jgi:hypothetical protein